jgi:hypothetical protein
MDFVAEETLDDLKRFVDCEVRAGFVACAEIPDVAVEVFAGEPVTEHDVRDYAVRFTARALATLQDESSSWPPITDCDRLDAAFAELEQCGVVARQNFTCCQTCGHDEAWDEVEAARERGTAVIGYTFYHQQDTESAVEGRGLLLAYGATERDDASLVAVAREIETVVRSHGLAVRWDGSVGSRIHVAIDWKKRRA